MRPVYLTAAAIATRVGSLARAIEPFSTIYHLVSDVYGLDDNLRDSIRNHSRLRHQQRIVPGANR